MDWDLAIKRNSEALKGIVEALFVLLGLVGEATVQIGDRRRTGGRQQREDVRFTLRERVVTQIGQEQADPVRRPMNRWNQT